MKHILAIFISGAFLLTAGFTAKLSLDAPSSIALAPASIVTLKGSTNRQPVSNLAVMDQTGTQDDPMKYVTFSSSRTIYNGYRQYYLPTTIKPSTVSAMTMRVNYKGPASMKQIWTWALFNWSTNKWVSIGTNTGAQANMWSLLTFNIASPVSFIQSTGEIRLLLTSNNTKGSAKLDFESINVTYTISPTANDGVNRIPGSPPGIGLTIDATLNRKPISPYIYGLNFAKPAFAQEISLPVRRWGGNDTSRYDWKTGNSNSASDWYYENMHYYDPYTGSNITHTDWINQNISTGTDSLITIPMLGYVAKDNTSCGFNTTIYGSQQSVDPYKTVCGNGINTSGQNITGNNPLDTSVVVDQNFMKSWVQSLVSAYGQASNGGVKFYALDNEPDLWGETHRDVHPSPQTYDELMSKTEAYAAAIKSADPSAQVFGYSSFGWTGYWYSEYDTVTAAANGYTYFPDYSTHGNMYQIPWYLSQMQQYQQTNGTRLLDYLDLHFYPENGVSLTTAGDATMQALRLRSTRSLWDPTYQDESWIGGSNQPVDWRYVRLIPRMHAWVNTYYPGTKLSLSEYNWGGLESINGALAQADILGIFGREGLDFATLWNYPDSSLGYDHFESLPGAYAYRIYRNYDGNGNKFGDVSVSSSSVDQSQLSVYAAQRSSDSALTLMVINKTSGILSGNISISGFTPSGNAQVYRYSAASLSAIVHLADQPVSTSGLIEAFPANSITLLIIPGK
jgi:hypothetical protein